jgi:hypothetical protein
MSDELISALSEPDIGVGEMVGIAAADRAAHQSADLINEPASPMVDVLRAWCR